MYAGVIPKGVLHSCSLEGVVSRRKKKRAQKSEWSLVTLGAPSSPSVVAGTWVREVDGMVRQLVVSKLDAT
jgi:hypothetical protein